MSDVHILMQHNDDDDDILGVYASLEDAQEGLSRFRQEVLDDCRQHMSGNSDDSLESCARQRLFGVKIHRFTIGEDSRQHVRIRSCTLNVPNPFAGGRVTGCRAHGAPQGGFAITLGGDEHPLEADDA